MVTIVSASSYYDGNQRRYYCANNKFILLFHLLRTKHRQFLRLFLGCRKIASHVNPLLIIHLPNANIIFVLFPFSSQNSLINWCYNPFSGCDINTPFKCVCFSFDEILTMKIYGFRFGMKITGYIKCTHKKRRIFNYMRTSKGKQKHWQRKWNSSLRGIQFYDKLNVITFH